MDNKETQATLGTRYRKKDTKKNKKHNKSDKANNNELVRSKQFVYHIWYPMS